MFSGLLFGYNGVSAAGQYISLELTLPIPLENQNTGFVYNK
jgi:hypothetical protein